MAGGQVRRLKSGKLPWQVAYYDNGKRRRKCFRTRIEADEFAASVRVDARSGDMAVTADERMLLARMRREAGRLGVSMVEVAERILDGLRASTPKTVSVTDAQTAFIADCEKRGLRMATLTQYRRYVSELTTMFDGRNVSDITRAEVLEWLMARYQDDASRRFARAAVLVWLRWCEHHGMCAGWEKPLTWKIRRTDERRISILTPGQFRAVLDAAPASIRAGLALMGFAGIRPEELVSASKARVLRWDDIDVKGRVIRIPGAVSKVRAYRALTGIPDNLWTWLKPGRGNVVGCNMRNFRASRKRAALAAGLAVWPKDVLRHSFASYGFHVLGAEHTIEILGHTNPRMFFRHYKGAASKADSEAWLMLCLGG